MAKEQTKKEQDQYEELEKEEIKKRKDHETIEEFTNALDEFSESANPKNRKEYRSYVYALCEKKSDGSLIPFYIGEGKGARVWSHEFDAKQQVNLLIKELFGEGIQIDLPENLSELARKGNFKELKDELKKSVKSEKFEELEEKIDDLGEKINKINEITHNPDSKIEKYIIKCGMTSKEAFMVESALINLLQIDNLKFNCRENDKLTNKVKGHQSEGEKHGDIPTAARTVEEFCEQFAKEPIIYEDLINEKVNAVLINIKNGYPECLEKPAGCERNKAIRDTVCGNWKLSEVKFKNLNIEYVFATVQARVIGIYKIKEVKVNGKKKKVHFMYEAVDENSGYPHEDTVSFRKGDYEDAQYVMKAAEKTHKHPSKLKLDDMEQAFRDKHIGMSPTGFKNMLQRKYMILDDLSENDPNYKKFMDYLHKRIIHKDGYKEETEKKRDSVFSQGGIRYIC